MARAGWNIRSTLKQNSRPPGRTIVSFRFSSSRPRSVEVGADRNSARAAVAWYVAGPTGRRELDATAGCREGLFDDHVRRTSTCSRLSASRLSADLAELGL